MCFFGWGVQNGGGGFGGGRCCEFFWVKVLGRLVVIGVYCWVCVFDVFLGSIGEFIACRVSLKWMGFPRHLRSTKMDVF